MRASQATSHSEILCCRITSGYVQQLRRNDTGLINLQVNPFGRAFSLINKSDLILVNHEAKVVDGGPNRLLNTAAYMIHSAIHSARPDVMCAAHSHSIYGRTFCTLGRKLDTLTQDSCAFHNDHVLYESFNGVVLAEKEGKDIAKCLGGAKAALLQNHGLLTVGATIEEVNSRYMLAFSRPSLTVYYRLLCGSSRWRSAATRSSWPRQLQPRGVRSQLRLVKRRLSTRSGLWAARRQVGSLQHLCSMLFTRRRTATICSR